MSRKTGGLIEQNVFRKGKFYGAFSKSRVNCHSWRPLDVERLYS